MPHSARAERSPPAEKSSGVDSAKLSITVISNEEKFVCLDPVYHTWTGQSARANFVTSCIVAMPLSDMRFVEVCYIQLKTGLHPVVVSLQKDGSIRLVGAYLDSIASELGLTVPTL